MARPQKEGLDYFPHDVDAVEDEKIDAMRSMYGNDGYAFYFILLERIYRTKEAAFDISKKPLFISIISKIGVNTEKFQEMLETAFELELFDRQVFDNEKKLTSNGIRKRHDEVEQMRARWRKNKTNKVFHVENEVENTKENIEENEVENIAEITVENIEDNCKENLLDNCMEKSSVNYEENKVENITLNPAENNEETGERKVKESKEKKSKVNIDNIYSSEFEQFWSAYPRKVEKGNAYKCFCSRLKEGNTLNEILEATKNYANECNRKGTDSQFIKHASSFLSRTKPFLDYIKKDAQKPSHEDSSEIMDFSDDDDYKYYIQGLERQKGV